MSDVVPRVQSVEPSQEDPHETDLERREAEEPGFGRPEESRPDPDAGDPTQDTMGAPFDDEHESGAHEPENAGTASLVAGHAADGHAAGEADRTWPKGGMPTASQLGAEQKLDLEGAPVFDAESATSYRLRWSSILTEFVDDPHRAVEDADRFVADVAQAFASSVESRRQSLSSAWEHDGHDQTEELRLTMRQYRMLVDRILTVSATSD